MRFIVAVAVAILISAHLAQATSYLVPVELSKLAGVDTVIVAYASGPGHQVFPFHAVTSDEIRNPRPDQITLAVREVFAKTTWVTVKRAQMVPVQEWFSPNAIVFAFSLSAQPDDLDGKPVKVAALGFQLWKFDSKGYKTAIATDPVAYSFIVPDKEDKLNQKITEGVKLLVGYLPSQFALFNKKESAPEDAKLFHEHYPDPFRLNVKVLPQGDGTPEHPFLPESMRHVQ